MLIRTDEERASELRAKGWTDVGQAQETRTCTCHPDDNPPVPCPRKFALRDCRRSALLGETQTMIIVLKNRDRQPHEQVLLDYLMRVRDVLVD